MPSSSSATYSVAAAAAGVAGDIYSAGFERRLAILQAVVAAFRWSSGDRLGHRDRRRGARELVREGARKERLRAVADASSTRWASLGLHVGSAGLVAGRKEEMGDGGWGTYFKAKLVLG